MTTKPQPDVLDPTTTEYVLPVPTRAAGDVVVVVPQVDAGRAFRRGGEVAQAIGDRFLMLAESQQIFTTELRERLREFDSSIADAPRAQLKGAVRDMLAVLEWSDAVHDDLLRESRLAAAGAEPIDVVDLCQEVAAEVTAQGQPVFVSGENCAPWWGCATTLAEAIRQSLAVVGERTQGVGPRAIEVSETTTGVFIMVAGVGEPADALDGASVARFRRAVEQVGARVRPNALGPGGAGLVLELSKAVANSA